MIWDLHVHLSGVDGATPQERLAQMIAIADRMGIDRLCVYLGMTFSTDPSPETLRKDNDQVLQAIGQFPDRAFGFVYLNPRHVEASLAAERVIYGSDVGGRSFASQLAKVFGADIPESARKLILGENLKRLLLPILKAKGIKV